MVTGVQTCALPISAGGIERERLEVAGERHGSGAELRFAQQAAGELNISTKSAGTQKVTTTAKGPAKSGSTAMKVDATVITSQVPDPIPVTGSTQVTVTALP